ncbi:MAG: hypothetical protein ACK4S5_07720 [Sphingobium yanoikuyae]
MKHRLDLPRNRAVADTDQRSLYEVWDTVERYDRPAPAPTPDHLLMDQPAAPTTPAMAADEPAN